MYHQPSILTSLRTLIPQRGCSFAEALGVAERQAAKLNQLIAATSPSYQLTGLTEHHLAQLPRIRIVHEPLPVSGMSHWNGQAWIICLNADDAVVRQRFTLLHEFKHIIDHGRTHWLYTNLAPSRQATSRGKNAAPGCTSATSGGTGSLVLAERAADYFAGCALVPRTALKQAWASGIQQPQHLADHFGVSEAAVLVRLDQTGLSRAVDPDPEGSWVGVRCQRLVRSASWQDRQRWRVASPGYRR